MIRQLDYTIGEVVPYINWVYFDHAWSVSVRSGEVWTHLHEDAVAMLRSMADTFHTHALFGLFDANSDGDDLVLGDCRIPMLRQQHPSAAGQANLCLADFVRPKASGLSDSVGAFAATVDLAMENSHPHDDYLRMLAQTLADRLAEATAEKLHEDVRRTYWGYAPDEHLSMEELHREAFQGIRPAVGYPSMPDTSINFLLSDLLGMKRIGIRLTESGAMKPHASVSGLMIAHPQARYFSLGKIGEDQLRDYARRRGLPVELVRRFLAGNLE